MEKHSSKLSFSISRLLGTTDEGDLVQINDNSLNIASDGTEERSLRCGQDESAQQNKVEQLTANSQSKGHEGRCIYPWMTQFNMRNKGKKKRSKGNIVVYR